MRNPLFKLLCLVVVIFNGGLAHAVELLGRPQVAPGPTSATVSWKTDVECGTRLQYGLNPAQLNQKREGAVSSQHEVSLEGLVPGTTYYYSLGSARAQLAAGSFTTGGAAPSAAPQAQPSLIRRVLEAVVPSAAPKPAPASAGNRPVTGKDAALTAPPTRQTWANVATLQDHFDRHGRDFGSTSADDYAAKAWLFLQRARAENLPMKLDDTDRTLRVFDIKTGAFAAYNDAGRTKTYFKPGSPGYWQRQPGRQVTSPDLRFPTSIQRQR